MVHTYEVVGDSSHTVVLPHREAHQEVPADSDNEDNEIHDDEDPLGRGRFHVTHDHVYVLVVRHAVIVRAHRDVRGVGPRGIGRRCRERFRVHWTGVLEVRDRCHSSVQPRNNKVDSIFFFSKPPKLSLLAFCVMSKDKQLEIVGNQMNLNINLYLLISY